MIKLTAMTSQGQWRSFSFECYDLEQAYQVLHTIVQRGDTLVNVTWLDGQGSLPLPLDGLQDAIFLNPIEALRQQWERLLTRPIGNQLSIAQVRQQLMGHRQERLVVVRRTLGHIHELIERTHQHLKDGSERTKLLNHYQQMLDRYSRLLIKLETASQPVSPVDRKGW